MSNTLKYQLLIKARSQFWRTIHQMKALDELSPAILLLLGAKAYLTSK